MLVDEKGIDLALSMDIWGRLRTAAARGVTIFHARWVGGEKLEAMGAFEKYNMLADHEQRQKLPHPHMHTCTHTCITHK